MGGFNSTFVRIPDGSDAWDFATYVARLLHAAPEVPSKEGVHVQYVEGFSWLHVEELIYFPKKPEGCEFPVFQKAGLESIWLLCHGGSGSHCYLHYLGGECLRCIAVGDGHVDFDFGTEEAWERQARDDKAARYAQSGDASDFSWPKAFDTEMVLGAFDLPFPDDLEVLDICICVSNPDENDMARALPE